MDRRTFIQSSSVGIAALATWTAEQSSLAAARKTLAAGPPSAIPVTRPASTKLFSAVATKTEWESFSAAGFTKPVAGVVFSADQPPCCGVPLGGISTGCLDIEANGTLGFNCLFDAFPRKPQLLKPFLGLAVGNKTWVLTSESIRAGGVFETCHEQQKKPTDWMVTIPMLKGVHSAKQIRYWGHFPVADLEFDLEDSPVSVGLRAWAPFIPGDTSVSNTPGAVFEIHLRNTASAPLNGTLAFSFPGPTQQEAQVPADVPPRGLEIGGMHASRPVVEGGVEGRQRRVESPVNGVSVEIQTGVNYCLGVLGEQRVRTGGGIRTVPLIPGGSERGEKIVEDWAHIATALPPESPREFGATVAVDFSLQPKEEKTIRYALTWYAPMWCGEGEKKYTQMYTTRFKSALEVAGLLAREHESLLKRVLAWQEAIYSDPALPGWLQDTLINVMATIPEDSYWAKPVYPLAWAPGDGLYGMNECPRGSPQIECIPCSWYGNIPIVYFFPELALSTLRGYVHYMREDGAAPFRWGPGSDFDNVTWEWQKSLNGVCFVDMVGRLWLRTQDDAILREMYPAVKKSTTCTMTMRPAPEGIVSMPKGNVGREWWEAEDWYGVVPHIGAMRLSNLKIAERMAEKMGDTAFARQCQDWYSQGSEMMEKVAWQGEYYLHFNEPETGRKSDTIMANQIDGDWSNAFHGLPGIFQAERLKKTLETVKRTCLNEACGAVSFAYGDGTPQRHSYGIFPPEIMILGMMYLYVGDRETGQEIVRRLMYDLTCRHRYAFDLPNMIYCDTGGRWFGTDYYQDMMLWAMPSAMLGKDIHAPCLPGGLVDRVIQAGKAA
ncbi:MAG: GH116 family glycosyl-hydrolase [Terriglobia bacterium]